MNILKLLLVLFVVIFFFREYFSFKRKVFMKYLLTPLVMVLVLFVVMVSVAVNGPGVMNLSVLTALVLALIADVMLMVEEVDLLKNALPFISLSHVIYVSVFLRGMSFEIWNIGVFALLVCSGGYIYIKIRKRLLSLRLPVLAYIFIISAMVYSAVAKLNSGAGYYEVSVASGAVLLYVSDLILAYNKYVKPIENSTVFTWLFYGPGQLLIAFSTITYFGNSM